MWNQLSSSTVCGNRAVIELGQFLLYPQNESSNVRMSSQFIPSMVLFLKLLLSEGSVNLAVTDSVNEELLLALARLRNEVMSVDVFGSEITITDGTLFSH